jgi:SAM-dependent methyltransferase
MVERFRAGHAFPPFCEALREAGRRLGDAREILVLGCAPGFAGQRSDYACGVVTEVLGGARPLRITSREVSRRSLQRHMPRSETWRGVQTYDLVVTHSLMHFVLDFEPLLRQIAGSVRPGGCYVLGHEPNARYWRNAACVAALTEWRRARAERQRSGWRGFVRRSLERLRPLRESSEGVVHAEVNAVLRAKGIVRTLLRPAEMDRIVDPHRRPERPAARVCGEDGLNCAEFPERGLRGFALVWSTTYGHLGYGSPEGLPDAWKARTNELRAAYPQDGANISAVFQRGDT